MYIYLHTYIKIENICIYIQIYVNKKLLYDFFHIKNLRVHGQTIGWLLLHSL